MREREINLTDLIVEILCHWRRIVVAMLIGMIVFGCVSYVQSYRTASELDEQTAMVKEQLEIEDSGEKLTKTWLESQLTDMQKYNVDYAFFSNAMRYEVVKEKEYSGEVLITSNLLDVSEEQNVLNYADLCFDEKGKCDNCVIMILKLLIKLGVKKVHLAGFDGYQQDGNNYITSYMASQHTKGHEENVKNSAYIANIRKQMELCFLTESIYDK